jgi:hypothetical protein
VSAEGEKMDSRKEKERSFSVELKSRANLTNFALGEGSQENVLIEGTLSNLERASLCDCVVLEVVGEKGVLRINLTKDEIREEGKKNDIEN